MIRYHSIDSLFLYLWLNRKNSSDTQIVLMEKKKPSDCLSTNSTLLYFSLASKLFKIDMSIMIFKTFQLFLIFEPVDYRLYKL